MCGSMLLLQLVAMLMSVAHVTTKDDVDVCSLYRSLKWCGCPVGHAAAGGPVDVNGLCSHLRPCWYLCSVVLTGAMMVSGLCCGRGLCWNLWSVLSQETMLSLWYRLSPETMWKFMIHAPPECKGQGNYFCSGLMTADHSWERGIQKASMTIPTPKCPLPRNVTALTKSHHRELLKIVARIFKCISPQLMASGRLQVRKDLVFFKGLGIWSLTMLPLIYVQYKGDFCFFLGGKGVTMSEDGPERTGKWLWQRFMIWNSKIINKNIEKKPPWPKATWGGKGFFSPLTVPCHCSSPTSKGRNPSRAGT